MKVLIATDGSAASLNAIREAARLLPLKEAEVHVLAVANVAPLLVGVEAATAATAAVIEREMAATAIDATKAIVVLEEMGIKASEHKRSGNPVSEILAIGRDLNPDVLVLGAHQKSALERFFFGSTSEGVLHQWTGSLLIVRGDEPYQAESRQGRQV